ncbi:MAG: hypothetical protein J6S38_03020 [Erysipelotrichaceae bacterium]|nr:hypothetical protein [Erysipelotrichaceae bacterium]MBP5280706.1 hypothetical protein [Erysipelotrichaceae bacterium]
MKIEINTIRQLASDGKVNEGTELVDVRQAKITFDKLPSSLQELKAIDRSGENGRFLTLALLICAYKTWRPDDQNTCEAMMRELFNSPTVKDCYNNFTKEFVKDRMLQNGKWEYIADAYFDGAKSTNGYKPDLPLTITVKEFPYLPQTSTIYDVELSVDRIVIEFEGADTSRNISVYQDPADRKWYVWSDTYKGLLADIREPEK